MAIHQKLASIQQELKVPKSLFNDFGKYRYRSAESILETVKPLLAKYNVLLTLDDTVSQLGDHFYIRATATLYDLDDDTKMTVSASARESDAKKGMDSSQLSGTASSYARKYCLNGLFLLDDSKDADTNEFHHETSVSSLEALKKTVKSECKKAGINPDAWLSANNRTWDTVTGEELSQMLRAIKDRQVA